MQGKHLSSSMITWEVPSLFRETHLYTWKGREGTQVNPVALSLQLQVQHFLHPPSQVNAAEGAKQNEHGMTEHRDPNMTAGSQEGSYHETEKLIYC